VAGGAGGATSALTGSGVDVVVITVAIVVRTVATPDAVERGGEEDREDTDKQDGANSGRNS